MPSSGLDCARTVACRIFDITEQLWLSSGCEVMGQLSNEDVLACGCPVSTQLPRETLVAGVEEPNSGSDAGSTIRINIPSRASWSFEALWGPLWSLTMCVLGIDVCYAVMLLRNKIRSNERKFQKNIGGFDQSQPAVSFVPASAPHLLHTRPTPPNPVPNHAILTTSALPALRF